MGSVHFQAQSAPLEVARQHGKGRVQRAAPTQASDGAAFLALMVPVRQRHNGALLLIWLSVFRVWQGL